ncbi:hypothetical protein Aduo_018658 [Ancylostoma duodenale]
MSRLPPTRMRSTPTFSRTAVPTPHTKLRSHDAASLLTRKMHDERFQKGLEKSLNPSEARNRTNPRRYDLFSSSCASSMNCMGQTSTAAIDSKIEQAMDLVKTHLMFAVREEVDILRTKIADLDSYVFRLETENAVLRAHIPEEVLRNINFGHPG